IHGEIKRCRQDVKARNRRDSRSTTEQYWFSIASCFSLELNLVSLPGRSVVHCRNVDLSAV
ncbi:hypothetical protein J6590_104929, partial [Homalodisca vitripennis]